MHYRGGAGVPKMTPNGAAPTIIGTVSRVPCQNSAEREGCLCLIFGESGVLIPQLSVTCSFFQGSHCVSEKDKSSIVCCPNVTDMLTDYAVFAFRAAHRFR